MEESRMSKVMFWIGEALNFIKAAWLVIVLWTALVCFSLFAFTFLAKVMWAWTIPDLFPGAVAQGLVVKSISWGTAFKLSLLAFLFAFPRSSKKR